MKSLEKMSPEELKAIQKEISKQLSLKQEGLPIDYFINHELVKELQELGNEVFLNLSGNLEIEIPRLEVEKTIVAKKENFEKALKDLSVISKLLTYLEGKPVISKLTKGNKHFFVSNSSDDNTFFYLTIHEEDLYLRVEHSVSEIFSNIKVNDSDFVLSLENSGWDSGMTFNLVFTVYDFRNKPFEEVSNTLDTFYSTYENKLKQFLEVFKN